MPTQPWLKLRRLIKEIKREYIEIAEYRGPYDSHIDIYWDGTCLTAEICINPAHASMRRHVHRGLWAASSGDESPKDAVALTPKRLRGVVSQE